MERILGRYIPFKINKLSNVDLCGEISDFGTNPNFDGIFEANIYQNGQLNDLELNGWTFGCNIKGNYHVPGTYYSTSYEVECFDPHDNELKLYSTPYKIRFYEDDVLRDYFDMINIYSHFENADIAIKFNYLSRSIDEGMYGARGRVPMKIKYGDLLEYIKFFRDYYEKLEEGTDELFMDKIKENVNGALDFLKERLDFDKIE